MIALNTFVEDPALPMRNLMRELYTKLEFTVPGYYPEPLEN